MAALAVELVGLLEPDGRWKRTKNIKRKLHLGHSNMHL